MKNRYPGKCTCGALVAVGDGETQRAGDRWIVVCASCARDVGNYQLPAGSEGGAAASSLASKPNASLEGDCGVVPPSTAEYTLLSGHAASAYQAAVFDHFKYGRSSAIIKAVAGAGKTTTIKNAVRYLAPRLSVQLLAFNVEAAGQLKAALAELERLGHDMGRVRAGTFHSLGFGAVLKHLNLPKTQVKVDDGKCRRIMRDRFPKGDPIADETHRLYAAFVTALVGFAKGEGVGCLRPDTEEAWYGLVEHHGMYLESEEADVATGVAIARRLLGWSDEAALTGWLDYDDMLYLVVRWKLRLWQNDVVVADEVQDTNPVRRALLKLALRPGGRLYAVGDPKQAIYGFTGASSDAMVRIAQEFNCRELPLTVSYRCARRVVERAQTWVEYIEPADGAPEGEVADDVPLHAALAQLTENDAILCRQTSPLVELAYGLIARGRPCRIMGREIGEGLVNLVEQMKARGLPRLIEKLETFCDREVARFTAKGDERRAEGVTDRVGCLLTIIDALPETEKTIPGLIGRVRSMFGDREVGLLTLATVHKAKGQEWPTVAILRPETMPSKAARQEWQIEQEQNLQYVAATRAKNTLIYCVPEDMTIDAPKGR